MYAGTIDKPGHFFAGNFLAFVAFPFINFTAKELALIAKSSAVSVAFNARGTEKIKHKYFGKSVTFFTGQKLHGRPFFVTRLLQRLLEVRRCCAAVSDCPHPCALYHCVFFLCVAMCVYYFDLSDRQRLEKITPV